MRKYPRAIVAVFLGAALCAVTPGSSAAIIDEVKIGAENDKKIEASLGFYEGADGAIGEYARSVGERTLAQVSDPEYRYTFRVVDTDMVNAFALPGGYIYLTRGLLATLNSEAAMANVIGHEIAHVIGHHAARLIAKSVASLLFTVGGLMVSEDARSEAGAWLAINSSINAHMASGFGKEFEIEADRVGMIFASEANYDPEAMSDFLRSIKRLERLRSVEYHGFFATHPDTIERIITTERQARALRQSSTRGDFSLARESHTLALDGLSYGRARARGLKPPYRIKAHRAVGGDSYRSIAEKYLGSTKMAIEIAALNGENVDAPIKPGRMIKALIRNEETLARPNLKSGGGKNEIGD